MITDSQSQNRAPRSQTLRALRIAYLQTYRDIATECHHAA